MKSFYRRTFLNKPRYESTGLVLADARMTTDGLEADLIIGDCSRQVILAFSVWVRFRDKVRYYDKGEIANIRHKASTLRKTVNDFLDYVETALDEMEAGDE